MASPKVESYGTLMRTLERLIKLNAWYAFACGIMSLIVAPLLVNEALRSLGILPGRIIMDRNYIVAVTFVRCLGVLLLVYTFLIRMLLRAQFDLEDLRKYFTLFAVGALLWGGMLLFVVSTKSIWLNIAAGIGLLEWLISPVWLIFNYKQQDSWKPVKPEKH